MISISPKIALVVHGRFYAFDMMKALLKREAHVTLFTNYPQIAVEKIFAIPRQVTETFPLHGVMSRLWNKLPPSLQYSSLEGHLHKSFSRWAARKIKNKGYDVIFAFSGVAEELFCQTKGVKILNRCSSHIQVQHQLLTEEEKRVGTRTDKPSEWMIKREKREYQLAHKIALLSTFAKKTFVDEGVSREKLILLPLGANLEVFRPSEEVIKKRKKRILSGKPLQVLTVGTFSHRKGMYDLIKIASEASFPSCFRFVGALPAENRNRLENCPDLEWVPKVPQSELPLQYEWGDVFLFPTIEDGFAVVLSQAQAAGLPLMTTPHCSGPDIITPGETGWILPLRSPRAFLDRLKWCHENREALAQMIDEIYRTFQPRTWDEVASEFLDLCRDLSLGGR